MGPSLAPTGELQWDQPTSSALRFRSLPPLDSPGAEDQRRQERQQVVSCAEFHAVACRGPSSLAGVARPPSPGSLSLLGPRLCPRANDKPSPAADGETDTRTDASPRQALKAGSILGSDVTSGESEPCPGLFARHHRSGARRTRCHSRWRLRGRGRRCPAMAPRAPVSGPRSPPLHTRPGLIIYPCFPGRWGRERRGGVEEKSNLPVIAPAYFTGGEMSH